MCGIFKVVTRTLRDINNSFACFRLSFLFYIFPFFYFYLFIFQEMLKKNSNNKTIHIQLLEEKFYFPGETIKGNEQVNK